MRHWANEYVGKPWKKGAIGPDAFDCMGLLRYVSERHYGTKIPHVDLESIAGIRDMVSRWEKVSVPTNGCGVKMSSEDGPHVGIFISVDGGRILHSTEKAGVQFSTVRQVEMMGMGPVEFYEYRG